MAPPRNTRLRYPGGPGVLWAVGAFGLTHLVVWAATVGSRAAVLGAVRVERRAGGAETLAAMLGVAADRPLKVALLFGFNAHLVPLRATHPDGGLVTANPLLAGDAGVASLVVVPPVLLAGAGFAATVRAGGPAVLRFDLFVGRDWTRYAFNAGLIPTLAYLLLVLVVAPFVVIEGQRTTVFVDLLQAWVQAGLAYPFVFGGLGGVLAQRYRRRRAPEGP